MQHAQPILLSHFLLAHAEAFLRDVTRLDNAASSADACPMGSGALGRLFVCDRSRSYRPRTRLSRITANSLDAVSDRDFALDYLFALSGIATHLSRLAEDFVLFASQEFGYVLLPDEYSTGSSLMPQKKNPDAWELLRGKTGRITGALVGLLTTLKGLPSGYQRDLQEDKEALFAAHDQIAAMLAVATGALTATKFNEEKLKRCRRQRRSAGHGSRGLPGAQRRAFPPGPRHRRKTASRSGTSKQKVDAASTCRTQKTFAGFRE